jgi:hypothetical protein
MALARDYLARHLGQMGTYSLALTANFLAAWGGDAARTTQVVDRLAAAIEAELEGAVGQHWQTDEQTTTYGNGPSAWIETTALATHALLVTRSHPQLAAWAETNVPEGFAVFNLPEGHRVRMRTTNGLERLNKELKRRTRVATLFPNTQSCERLVSALLAEQDEEWMSGKIYLNMKP